jgi:uroporphyrinogen-III synthase
MTGLAHLRVLVTRPAPEGEILCAAIREIAGIPCWLPAFSIVPPESFADIRKKIRQMDRTDWLIFVSPRAVRLAFPLIHEYWPQLPGGIRFAAIGKGTALALLRAGVRDVVYPEREASSAGLLAVPVFQDMTGLRVTLVKGAGGLPVLFDTLSARGAEMTEWQVYRRVLPHFDDNAAFCFAQIMQGKIDVTVCVSGEGLQNLLALAEMARPAGVVKSLQKLPLLVTGSRLATLAKNLGYEKILCAAGARTADMIAALASHARQDLGRSHKLCEGPDK